MEVDVDRAISGRGGGGSGEVIGDGTCDGDGDLSGGVSCDITSIWNVNGDLAGVFCAW